MHNDVQYKKIIGAEAAHQCALHVGCKTVQVEGEGRQRVWSGGIATCFDLLAGLLHRESDLSCSVNIHRTLNVANCQIVVGRLVNGHILCCHLSPCRPTSIIFSSPTHHGGLWLKLLGIRLHNEHCGETRHSFSMKGLQSSPLHSCSVFPFAQLSAAPGS